MRNKLLALVCLTLLGIVWIAGGHRAELGNQKASVPEQEGREDRAVSVSVAAAVERHRVPQEPAITGEDELSRAPGLRIELVGAAGQVDLSSSSVRIRSMESDWRAVLASENVGGPPTFRTQLAPLPFEVGAACSGFVGQAFVESIDELRLDAPTGDHVLRVELIAGRSVVGRLVPASDSAAPGQGHVFYFASRSGGVPAGLQELLALPPWIGGRVETEPDGSFQVPGLLTNADYTLWGYSSSGTSGPKGVDIGSESGPVEVVLYPVLGLELIPPDIDYFKASSCYRLGQSFLGAQQLPGTSLVSGFSPPLRWLGGPYARARSMEGDLSILWIHYDPARPPGPQSLGVNVPGYLPINVTAEPKRILPDEPLAPVPVELQPIPLVQGALEVVFREGFARPLQVKPEVEIGVLTLYPRDGEGMQLRTVLRASDYPVARLPCVDPGVYVVHFRSSGGLALPSDGCPLVSVLPGIQARVDLELGEWGAIEIRPASASRRLGLDHHVLNLYRLLDSPEQGEVHPDAQRRAAVQEVLVCRGRPCRVDLVPVGQWLWNGGSNEQGLAGARVVLDVLPGELTVLELP
jgi:hypothetical protein